MQRFEGQVQLVFYPFALNPTSEVATQAAWCAGEQGKFWEFHHMLYRRQEMFINDYRIVGTQSEGELVRLIRQELNRAQPQGQ